MTISRASASDIPALCELLGELFGQEAEFTPDREVQERGLGAIVGNPDLGTILIAKDGQIALGMVSLLYTISTALGARVALLEDMVVASSARGGGVGSALLNDAISTARAEGCGRITLLTDGDNEAAQRFYRRSGFQASSMVPLRLVL